MQTIGVDEVGRGSGAGPLMACAFVFLEQCEDLGLKDSKVLSPSRREKIFNKLAELRKQKKVNWTIISSPATMIDKQGIQYININALRLSAKALLCKIGTNNCNIIVDGNFNLSPIDINEKSYVFNSKIKADKNYPEVSAASIIAKVIRDKYMDFLHIKHPEYQWIKNKGYLTRDHCLAIQDFGLTQFHRQSFCNNLIEKK